MHISDDSLIITCHMSFLGILFDIQKLICYKGISHIPVKGMKLPLECQER